MLPVFHLDKTTVLLDKNHETDRAGWHSVVYNMLERYYVPPVLWTSIGQSYMPPRAQRIEPAELANKVEKFLDGSPGLLDGHQLILARMGRKVVPTFNTARSPCINFRRFTLCTANALVKAKVDRPAKRLLRCFRGEARKWIKQWVPNCKRLRFEQLRKALMRVPSAPKFSKKTTSSAAKIAARSAPRRAQRSSVPGYAHPADDATKKALSDS